jgi:hypothetical protein
MGGRARVGIRNRPPRHKGAHSPFVVMIHNQSPRAGSPAAPPFRRSVRFGLDAHTVIDRIAELLLAPEAALSGLDREVLTFYIGHQRNDGRSLRPCH